MCCPESLETPALIEDDRVEKAGPRAAAEFVGQTPWSARDALVPRPEQRYRHSAKREQADGGVGRSPGGLPHEQRGSSQFFMKFRAPKALCNRPGGLSYRATSFSPAEAGWAASSLPS